MARYFATYSGKLIDFNKLGYDDIDLQDIVHHLCNINRFGGALPYDKFYSVAQHSLALCSYIYDLTNDANVALHALLHDASEAYLGDVVSALKSNLSDYIKLEAYVQGIIYDKFNVQITKENIGVIDYFDKKILMDEVKHLTPEKYHLFIGTEGGEPIGIKLFTHISKEQTERSFFWWFNELKRLINGN